MFVRSVRALLLAGLTLAATALPARAGCDCGAPAPAGDCCAPAPCYKTITVTEWVPEQYEACRTVYKTECHQEKYTAYRTECVSETRTRKYCVTRQVPEYRDECRTVYVSVPCTETRTIYKTVVSYKTVTDIVRKCVDQGHYECREECVPPSCFAKLRHRCKGGCGEPCPTIKTVKVWVPCIVTIETPVCRTVPVCTTVPECVQVTVCKLVPKTETYKVCTYRCVTEEKCETYCVQVPRCVPYEACRTVTRCVPCVEKYTACRLVARCVQKQVPVEPCCESSCCEPSCCEPACCERKHKHGFFGRGH
jgi:hypothetical protein